MKDYRVILAGSLALAVLLLISLDHAAPESEQERIVMERSRAERARQDSALRLAALDVVTKWRKQKIRYGMREEMNQVGALDVQLDNNVLRVTHRLGPHFASDLCERLAEFGEGNQVGVVVSDDTYIFQFNFGARRSPLSPSEKCQGRLVDPSKAFPLR